MSALDELINRPRPSWLSLFLSAPLKTLAKTLYSWRKLQPRSLGAPTIRIVCTSDTHNSQPDTPTGDILIHAGDLTQTGTLTELQQTLDWLNRQLHTRIIAIAGNHDLLLDSAYHHNTRANAERAILNWGRINYLQDSSTTVVVHGRQLKVYGTPWTRKHGNWAFQFPAHATAEEANSAAAHFAKIPSDTDVLVSHMPPRFHLDVDGFGDEELLKSVKRVRPLLHVFGHVHEGYGREGLRFDAFEEGYERVCRDEAGVWEIVVMAWMLLMGGKGGQVRTVLANPSAVGGLRDTERRVPLAFKV